MIHVAGWQAAYRGILPDSVLDGLKVSERAGLWADWISGTGVHTILAEVGEEIVGFIRLCPARPIAGPPPDAIEVTHLYVHPSRQRRGTGQALLDHAVDIAAETRYVMLILWVLEANHPARRFYERFGFAPDGARHADPGFLGNDAAEVRYRLRIVRPAAKISTGRLRLRPLTLDDLDSLTEIWTDPAVSKYLLTRPAGRSEVEMRLYSMIEHARQWGMWAIEFKSVHTLIGRCGFYPYSGEGVRGPGAEPELAFFLARSHWGRGLATEAAAAILRELFRSSECPRAVALVHPQNAASRRIVDKLGMSPGPTVRIHGTEALLYSIERTTFSLSPSAAS